MSFSPREEWSDFSFDVDCRRNCLQGTSGFLSFQNMTPPYDTEAVFHSLCVPEDVGRWDAADLPHKGSGHTEAEFAGSGAETEGKQMNPHIISGGNLWP
ncbi:hypothetical protein ATANTOWER_000280 [Ataeniobius toweri]|uniref:Uncharacterized protein n=1 Tax=Ataeniobius toweri TaxID=208326 RepID=A0ABU7AV37_9TELE|nr:hypothetical protein [Ataeniobius toweri]